MVKSFIKDRYFYPGPVDVDVSIHLSAMTGPLYHRNSDFLRLFQECRQGLRKIFGTQQTPLILTSSGTGAMEALMRSCSQTGDSVVVINAGKFGERWGRIGEKLGRDVTTLNVEWGQSVSENFLENKIPTNTQAVFFQATETSTGLRLPVKQLAESIRKQSPHTLIIVDAVSAAVAEPLQMDDWGIDGMISGSQKGFGVAPGLSFLALSERAWKKAETIHADSFYLDMVQEKKAQEKGSGSWTTATTLVSQLHAALLSIDEHHLDKVHAHHYSMMTMTRKILKDLGIQLVVEDDAKAARSVTSFYIPEDSHLQKICKTWGIHLASGQDHLKGRILRIAHLGLSDPWNIITALQGVEMGLYQEGRVDKLGVASQIAQKILIEHNAASSENQ